MKLGMMFALSILTAGCTANVVSGYPQETEDAGLGVVCPDTMGPHLGESTAFTCCDLDHSGQHPTVCQCTISPDGGVNCIEAPYACTCQTGTSCQPGNNWHVTCQ
jgi:hypothetical protein